MSMFVLPNLLTQAADRCSGHLGTQSFLTRQGAQLAARIRSGVEGQHNAARRGFEKIGGETMAAGVSDSAVATLMGEAIGAEFTGILNANSCRTLDTIAESLAPLPPMNIGNLVSSIFALMGPDESAGSNSFNICRS